MIHIFVLLNEFKLNYFFCIRKDLKFLTMKRNETPKGKGVLRPGDQQTFIFLDENGQTIQNNIFDHKESTDPNLGDILKMLMKALVKILVALKFLVYKLWAKYIKGKDVPWFKLSVLAFFAFIVFQRDMQFKVDMKSPLSFLVADHEEDEEARTNGIAQKMSWKGDGGNPYAPASPDMLKNKATVDYIDRFTDIAVTEMHKYGVPASIKMAQALIESRAGDSRLATSNNNHFGMKCFSKNCKKGHCSNFFDDHHKDFFRKYGSAWESWRAHSKMLSGGRYEHLQGYGKNYEKWAHGLKKAGYATDKKYAEKLIAMIKKYDLDKLDRL